MVPDLVATAEMIGALLDGPTMPPRSTGPRSATISTSWYGVLRNQADQSAGSA